VVDPSKHQSRNWFETIVGFIPGFRGYLRKEYRRESDYLARTWMADRLQRSKSKLDEFVNNQVSQARLDGLDQIQRSQNKLDKLVSGLRSAVRGYSALFEYAKVNEGVLDTVYEHDMKMLQQVDTLAVYMEGLPASDDTASAVTSELNSRIDSLQTAFDYRGDMLKGLGDDAEASQ